jgi:peptidylprolyl isomerase
VLRDIAPSTTLDLLVGRLTHEDGAVRSAAAYFVARSDPEVWWDRRLDVRRALDSYDVDDPTALHLMAGLGRRMDAFSRPIVARFLRGSTDWRIRANAAAAIGSERSETGVQFLMLLRALDDPSPHVRLQAATGLAEAGPVPMIVEAGARWVRAHPDDRAPAGALLPFLARVGRSDVVLEHVRGLPAHDIPAWSEAIAALALVEGEEAVRELGRVLADPDVPETVARQASVELLDRWQLSRPMRETHEVFLDVAEGVVEGPRPRRAQELAPMLSDPSLRPRGEVLLRRLSERLPRRGARDAPATAPSGRLEVDWEALRRLGPRPRLVLETDRGTIVLRMRTEEAPLTVQAIAALAESGRYDGTPFHRVVPNFVIQGGDVSRGDGGGGPGFVIRSELTRTPYERGVLGMASSGKDTEGSQFFVTHAPQPHLDGGYTAFGWVERGMEVVDVIVRGDRIVRARVFPGS